jgi:hypothetical protein
MRLTALWLGLAAGLVASCAQATPRPKLMAHYMPWYESKDVSGRWGWHWTMDHFDPDVVDDSGRRQIASHQYPAIGPYDSSDPDLLAYHFLLMKVAGIDGVIIDWYGAEDVHDYASLDRATNLAVEAAEAFGLQYAICYEDRTLRAMVDVGHIAPEAAVEQARRELTRLEDRWFLRDGYARVDGRPILLVFGPEYLTDGQWDRALDGMASRPAFFTLHQQRGPADGLYAWPPMWAAEDGTLTPTRLAEYFDSYMDRAGRASYSIPAAFPGFHDIYAEAGVQETHGVLDHRDGATFDETLAVALSSGAQIAQLVTWNDFGEGTVIEPTREFGYRYLEAVQVATRRGADTPNYTPADLRLPALLYGLRKRHAGNASLLARLRVAERSLADGQAQIARAELDSIPAR